MVGGKYWYELLGRIRDICSSEKVLYRQVLDLYATSLDYNPKALESIKFFKIVQNKLHYATHGNTASEVIIKRANAGKPFMGLLSFSNGGVSKKDIVIAKNYLDEKELKVLNNFDMELLRGCANSPGPWSLYLFSRLEHPVIRGEIEATIFEAVRGKYSKERIAREYDERFVRIKTFTHVSFGKRRSHTTEDPFGPKEIISLRETRRDAGKAGMTKRLHISEAHEKGHVMRFEYSEEWTPPFQAHTEYVLSDLFDRAFGFSHVEFEDEEYQRYRASSLVSIKISNREIRKLWIADISSPYEIAERMSQLKNYFGFCGDEIFTKEHFWCARKNYLQDTEYDNAMSPFFSAIPPNKKGMFLELMNSVGI